MGVGVEQRHLIARRAAKEIKPGMLVNLGIGIPTLVADYIPQEWDVMFHAENGILGTGPSPEKGKEDENLCNAGGFPITLAPGASYFDSTVAFGMIRRGYLDITILGALEVSEKGDLANWIVPGKRVPGMGGAIELAQKAKKVIVLMNHTNKAGEPKILRKCTLPLTAPECVDMIITERAVIEVVSGELHLREVLYPYTVEQVVESTEAPLKIMEGSHVPVFK
ncbi:3-oxoacid CoA-transferase subunit B [Aneurinibacillus aneurinilyticus]|jgi:acetate CoA/acetoacetate CoA-transferase beta subunit|uniref:CoA transferase subunit B n=2 Tax=Aneurinibacillus aneurinilyticus TaxID=1391 RepID=A0A848CUK8_ANEAE|nr:3-oxoacid CoA-transferase subunit B [Aneurinibacillus aneurinilyticus]ERI09017.1 butyrate--acetoacetate CoA-transferase subunit B [Aneurinibacillus aneurinilyticus ATCC 12856]MCI1695758.1 3-oxoacid CoA-transferase subunit B [Aneurinibacillus aneurinilyticus]MED0672991.1 3-oxoacid CoA-transferase subunit B [Aneurinibacillus aneurinilyticus]MED0709587.1 3-oxoacid CoA-transferase subunit B [Aneurinibacillus aneurinilyticus]MED0723435.1 3-oxoacid CoA-transferase subunit B [Aneurinibacillus aneu